MSKRYHFVLIPLISIVTLLPASKSTAQPLVACCAQQTIPSFQWLCLNVTAANCLIGSGLPANTGSSCTTTPDVLFGNSAACWATIAGLPVELTSFDAKVEGSDVTLSWSTASELNNAGFAIEKEIGSDVFEEIGFAEGHGTTDNAQNYRFVVEDATAGVNRFRLKQIDFDGAFEYSEVVEAMVALPDQFAIEPAYPNPFNPSTTFRFAVATEQQVSVTLVNAAGQVVQSVYNGTVPADDMQSLSIDAGGLPSGTYMIRLQGEQGLTRTQSIVLAK